MDTGPWIMTKGDGPRYFAADLRKLSGDDLWRLLEGKMQTEEVIRRGIRFITPTDEIIEKADEDMLATRLEASITMIQAIKLAHARDVEGVKSEIFARWFDWAMARGIGAQAQAAIDELAKQMETT